MKRRKCQLTIATEELEIRSTVLVVSLEVATNVVTLSVLFQDKIRCCGLGDLVGVIGITLASWRAILT